MPFSSEQYKRQAAEKMIRDKTMATSSHELAALMDAFDVFIEHFPVHRSVELVEIARLRSGSVNLSPALVAEIMTTIQRMERRTDDRPEGL